MPDKLPLFSTLIKACHICLTCQEQQTEAIKLLHGQIYYMLNPSTHYFRWQLLPLHQEKKPQTFKTAPFLVVLQLTLTSVRPLIFKYPQR